MSSETKKHITLKTSYNGETFEVEIDVMMSQSQKIKHMIEEDCTLEFILVPVDGEVLAKVIDYCRKHYKSDEKTEKEIREWDIEFMNSMNTSSLVFLISAASYLEIKSLMDLTAQKTADDIKDKPAEEVLEIFNLKKDFSPEEVEKLKKAHGWV